MPTYDYACDACGHTFEHFQPMGDKLLRTCPKCGKKKLQRLIGSGAGIVFKGSGFYETDYKRKEAPKSEGSSGGDGDSSSSSKTPSKKASDSSSGSKSSSDD